MSAPNRPNNSRHAGQSRTTQRRISPSRPCPGPLSFPHRQTPETPRDHLRRPRPGRQRLLGDARTIADAMRAFVPGSWAARLELDTLRPLPAEHVNAELHRAARRPALDRRAQGRRCRRHHPGGPVHPGPRMPARMMTLHRAGLRGPDRRCHGAGRQQPAVLPIVLYTACADGPPQGTWPNGRGHPRNWCPMLPDRGTFCLTFGSLRSRICLNEI